MARHKSGMKTDLDESLCQKSPKTHKQQRPVDPWTLDGYPILAQLRWNHVLRWDKKGLLICRSKFQVLGTTKFLEILLLFLVVIHPILRCPEIDGKFSPSTVGFRLTRCLIQETSPKSPKINETTSIIWHHMASYGQSSSPKRPWKSSFFLQPTKLGCTGSTWLNGTLAGWHHWRLAGWQRESVPGRAAGTTGEMGFPGTGFS